MTTVTDDLEQDVPLTAEQQAEADAAADEAMLHEFAAHEGTAPTPTTTPELSSAGSSAAPEQTVPPPEPEPKPISLTDEQLASVLAAATEVPTLQASVKKLADDVLGRVGPLEQWVKDLRAATPAGQPLVASVDDFAELKEEFPELTERHVKGLNRILSKFKGTGPGITSDAFRQELTQAVGHTVTSTVQVVREMEARESLTELYPGWETVVGLPDADGGTPPETPYRKWLGTQPQDYRDKLNRTSNPVIIGRSIEQFQKFEADQKKPKPPVSSLASSANARRQQLASAVSPKPSGALSPAQGITGEEDAIMAGYEIEKGR